MNLTAAYKAVLIEMRALKEKVSELERKLNVPEPIDTTIVKRGPGRPRKTPEDARRAS